MAEKCAGWVYEDGSQMDCQFEDETDDHDFKGKSYCRFHLPMGAPGEGGKADWDNHQKVAISDTIVERIKGEVARSENARKGLDFRGIVVLGTLNLNGQIIGPVDFSGVQFHGPTLFSQAQFDANAWFSGSQFHEFTSFSRAHFGGDVWFDKAQFHARAWFTGSVDTAQREARVFNHADFYGTRFGSDADFSNRDFRGPTDFTGAVFEEAPNFHGSTLHQDTGFGGIECFPDVTSPGADRAYRTLRQAMEGHRARLEEGMFYALEQKARRRLMKRFDPAGLISLAYELGSNYGLSVGRPVAWFGGGLFVSAIMLLGVGMVTGANADVVAQFIDALLFSARQAFLPFDALRTQGTVLNAYAFNSGGVGWLRAWGVFLTLFEASAALLLVLAVRWRYRR